MAHTPGERYTCAPTYGLDVGIKMVHEYLRYGRK